MEEISRPDHEIARLAATNKEEFRELYQRYAAPIYRFVRYRVHREEDAQDLVSHIFLKSLERINQYKAEYAFSTWLYTIARNTIIDFWRTQKIVIDLEQILEIADTTANISDSMDVSLYIERIMDQLSESERIIVTLRFEEDLSFKEISQITGRSEQSLRTAFHRLKKKIELL